jgi:hypothetical protein
LGTSGEILGDRSLLLGDLWRVTRVSLRGKMLTRCQKSELRGTWGTQQTPKTSTKVPGYLLKSYLGTAIYSLGDLWRVSRVSLRGKMLTRCQKSELRGTRGTNSHSSPSKILEVLGEVFIGPRGTYYQRFSGLSVEAPSRLFRGIFLTSRSTIKWDGGSITYQHFTYRKYGRRVEVPAISPLLAQPRPRMAAPAGYWPRCSRASARPLLICQLCRTRMGS